MNRQIGAEVGSLIGEVTEVDCNVDGVVVGKCIRTRVQLDVREPLLRWTNFNIGGVFSKVMFRYEKLANFCFAFGRLNHLVKNCTFTYPNSLCHYGAWLRANGKNPPSFEEAAGDLNFLNAKKLTIPFTSTPINPIANADNLS